MKYEDQTSWYRALHVASLCYDGVFEGELKLCYPEPWRIHLDSVAIV